jgi:transcriptional regulator with PAS, ATPase and Fis domain
VVALGLAHREPAAPVVCVRRPDERYADVVGAETTLKQVFETVERVAPTRASVLVLGESGTGKEVVARFIHRISDRSAGPFVAVNCAAIPEALLESELFGVEKGTATGVTERRGRFETADKGTAFLDEIGDMTLNLQAKMLRVLQDRTFERVGGRVPVTVDVRIVAATNRDLDAEIEKGAFRRDLFYRLNVVTLRLPPLRERRADIPELVRRFCCRFSQEYGKSVSGADDDCLACLLAYEWPGNVRELENVVERGVILARDAELARGDLPPALQAADSQGRPVFDGPLTGEARRQSVVAALENASWNVSRAARVLGISRRQLHRVIVRLGLARPDSGVQTPEA